MDGSSGNAICGEELGYVISWRQTFKFQIDVRQMWVAKVVALLLSQNQERNEICGGPSARLVGHFDMDTQSD